METARNLNKCTAIYKHMTHHMCLRIRTHCSCACTTVWESAILHWPSLPCVYAHLPPTLPLYGKQITAFNLAVCTARVCYFLWTIPSPSTNPIAYFLPVAKYIKKESWEGPVILRNCLLYRFWFFTTLKVSNNNYAGAWPIIAHKLMALRPRFQSRDSSWPSVHMKTRWAQGPKGWSYIVWKSTSEVENAQCDSAVQTHDTCSTIMQCIRCTRNFTTATSQPDWHFCTVPLAHGWRLHYANDAGSYNGMQSIEHCTGCRTKLYAVRACCTVYNTHAERSCEAMAEWVTFEADFMERR